jgi:hypothetical protein
VNRSPAQTYALVIGATLLVAGIVGFLYTGDFSTGDATKDPENRDAVFGILDVNGWHNVVHVLTGLAGLAVAGSYAGARAYAITLGGVYFVVALLGIIAGDGDSLFGLLPVNTEDTVLHAAISFTGMLAGIGTPAAPRPTLAKP